MNKKAFAVIIVIVIAIGGGYVLAGIFDPERRFLAYIISFVTGAVGLWLANRATRD